MSIGYIYIMTTCIDGLIKIGKSNNWKNRVYALEKDGYRNITGLKCFYVTKVNDYDEKELIIQDIFSASRVGNTELFALDKHKAKRMLDAFNGIQVFPITNNITPNKLTKKFSFDFNLLNIPIGSKLTCTRRGVTLEVTTVDNTDQVKLSDGSIMSITDAEKTINPTAYNGFQAFKYNGICLSTIWTKINKTKAKKGN